jgi:hypothetical protein
MITQMAGPAVFSLGAVVCVPDGVLTSLLNTLALSDSVWLRAASRRKVNCT